MAWWRGYHMILVDDYSRVAWPYCLTTSDVPAAFRRFLNEVRAQENPRAVQCLRTSTPWSVYSATGTDLMKQEFVALLNRHDIRREYTSVDFPTRNGVAERCIATTLKIAMASCL